VIWSTGQRRAHASNGRQRRILAPPLQNGIAITRASHTHPLRDGVQRVDDLISFEYLYMYVYASSMPWSLRPYGQDDRYALWPRNAQRVQHRHFHVVDLLFCLVLKKNAGEDTSLTIL
jgi:hypothetical protein